MAALPPRWRPHCAHAVALVARRWREGTAGGGEGGVGLPQSIIEGCCQLPPRRQSTPRGCGGVGAPHDRRAIAASPGQIFPDHAEPSRSVRAPRARGPAERVPPRWRSRRTASVARSRDRRRHLRILSRLPTLCTSTNHKPCALCCDSTTSCKLAHGHAWPLARRWPHAPPEVRDAPSQNLFR